MSIKITALYDRLSRDDEQTDTYRPQTHRMHLLTCSHNVLDKETNSAKTKNHGVIKRKHLPLHERRNLLWHISRRWIYIFPIILFRA